MAAESKFAAHLVPGEQINLHGRQQTVTRIAPWLSGDTAVFTDYTGDDPWLLNPGHPVTLQVAGEEANRG